tara:strand:+ start:1380 stop:1955 length:576 start_codon:yes stop_codon:yes gene_type:complete
MKNLLILLLSIPLIFSSCKKEEVIEKVIELPCLCESGQTDNPSTSISDTEGIILFFPNSFTPNGDGTNDHFKIILIHWSSDTINNNSTSTSIPYNLFIDGNQVVFEDPNVGPIVHWSGSGYLNGLYNFQITFNFNGLNYQKHGKVSIIRDISNISNDFECYPQGISNCTFGDMIDPYYGFIYPTNEDINNW